VGVQIHRTRTGSGNFEAVISQLIVTYIHMVNAPSQCMLLTNAFAVTRGDKMALRPFDKLLWALVQFHFICIRFFESLSLTLSV